MNKARIAMMAVVVAVGIAAPSKAPAQQCAGLIQQYRAEIDTASRYAALNRALGDSATAANEAKESNALSRARMALEAIRSAGCKTATLLPSPNPYMPSANRCKLDSVMSRFGGEQPLTCNPMKWQKSKP